MSGTGGPHGVVLTYENVNVAITSDVITVATATPVGVKVIVKISQKTGEVISSETIEPKPEA